MGGGGVGERHQIGVGRIAPRAPAAADEAAPVARGQRRVGQQDGVAARRHQPRVPPPLPGVPAPSGPPWIHSSSGALPSSGSASQARSGVPSAAVAVTSVRRAGQRQAARQGRVAAPGAGRAPAGRAAPGRAGRRPRCAARRARCRRGRPRGRCRSRRRRSAAPGPLRGRRGRPGDGPPSSAVTRSAAPSAVQHSSSGQRSQSGASGRRLTAAQWYDEQDAVDRRGRGGARLPDTGHARAVGADRGRQDVGGGVVEQQPPRPGRDVEGHQRRASGAASRRTPPIRRRRWRRRGSRRRRRRPVPARG